MHRTKQKYTRQVEVYDTNVIKNITRLSWYMIPMPDTVSDQLNMLGKYEQELLVFNCHRGRLIGDVDVYLTGVDGDANEYPLKIESKNDLNYQENQEGFHTNQEDQTIQQPNKVKLDPLEEVPTKYHMCRKS